jgi:hypothetical protein
MYAHLVMLSETVMPHCERPRAHSLNFDKPSRGRGGYFLFDLIFIKKKNKTSSNQLVSIWFDFLEKKPFQIRLARFFLFDSIFPVWLGFFLFGVGSVFLVSGL